MLTMYRFMNRENGRGELEPIVRYQRIDFPLGGPAKATAEQKNASRGCSRCRGQRGKVRTGCAGDLVHHRSHRGAGRLESARAN